LAFKKLSQAGKLLKISCPDEAGTAGLKPKNTAHVIHDAHGNHRSHRVSARIACPFCGAVYDAAKNLSAGEETRLEGGPLRLRCGRCGQVFVSGARAAAPSRAVSSVPRWLGGAAGIAVVAVLAYGSYRLLAWLAPQGVSPSADPRTVGATRPDTQQHPATPIVPLTGSEPASGEDGTRPLAISLSEEFGVELAIRVRRPFLVALEKAPHFAVEVLLDSYVEQIERLHEAIRKDFAPRGDAKMSERILPVIILASRGSYDRYLERNRRRAMPGSVGGHYEYGRRRLVLYHGPRGETPVLFHEGTHQLVHHYAHRARADGNPNAFWFQEGLACYYEAFGRGEKGEFVFHVVNRQRLPAAAEAVEAKTATPLGALLSLSVDDIWKQMEDPTLDAEARTRRAQKLYAEAWALWHYLLNTPRHRASARTYFEDELAGGGGIERFKALFGDLGELERDLHEYIRKLKTKEGKE
jgi:hypothetical protein